MAKTNPLAGLSLIVPSSNAQPAPKDIESHLMMYLIDVWTYACMRVLGDWVESQPFYVERKRIVDGEEKWERDTSHFLNPLLRNANQDESFGSLLNRTSLSIDATGNGYNTYDSAELELWYAKPSWIKVKVDDAGRVVAYEAQNRGVKRVLEHEEVIHYRLPNPKGDYYGQSPLEVIKTSVLTKHYLTRHLKTYFKNNAMIGTTFTTDQVLADAQREAMRQEFLKMHAGPDNAGKVAFLDGGSKLGSLSHAIKDLLPVELYKAIREEALAANQTPPVMVGVLEHASYANADNQKKIWIQTRALTRLRLMEDALTRVLLPTNRREERLYRIRVDRKAIPELQEDHNEVSARKVSEYKHGIITLNEAREALFYEPDPVGGDNYYLDNLTAATFSEPGGEQEGERSMTSRRKSDDPRLSRLKLHDARVTDLEKRMQRIMVAFFDRQADRVVERLQQITVNGRMMSRLGIWLGSKNDADNDAEFAFPRTLEDKEIEAATGTFIRSTLREAAIDEMNGLGVDLAFDMQNPDVIRTLQARANQIKKVNDTTYEAIKEVLRQSYEEGQGIQETERAIREKFDQFGRVRSTRIATTEMNGVVNGGNWLADKQAGVTHKIWMSAHLTDSRATHLAADQATKQKPVPIDSPFIVGGYALMYPGDPSGPAHETVNCHCVTQAIFKEDL